MKLSASKHFTSGSLSFQKFGTLLLSQLAKMPDIEVVSEQKKSDVHLCVISEKKKPNTINVLRVDGVYYDKKRIQLNKPIRQSIESFDGVIYQSKWAELFCNRMLRVTPKQSAVIYNGALQSKYKKIPKVDPFEKILICSALWRTNKRLETIVRAFIEVCDQHKNIGLYVVGEPDFILQHPNIKYFGRIDNNLELLYGQSDFMCHICHLEACSNSVVEGLSAGLPILCNNIGGTPEVVGNSGLILDLDIEFNFRPIKDMQKVGPKSIDSSKVRDGMIKILSMDWDIKRPDLDIKESAKNYYEFFQKL